MSIPYTPFALLTPRLIILPTPSAIAIHAYRDLYSHLLASPEFCTVAFGDFLAPQERDDAQITALIRDRDVTINWEMRGMGDFAVGTWQGERNLGRLLTGDVTSKEALWLVEGADFAELSSMTIGFGEAVQWVGYAGLREARLPPRTERDATLPSGLELIEVRYGYDPNQWGKGYGTEAGRAVMVWGEKEMSVRRFIASVLRANVGSGGVLAKLGFQTLQGTELWKDGDVMIEMATELRT